MVQPMAKIQQWALFAPLAQHFTIKQLQNLTQDHVNQNESLFGNKTVQI